MQRLPTYRDFVKMESEEVKDLMGMILYDKRRFTEDNTNRQDQILKWFAHIEFTRITNGRAYAKFIDKIIEKVHPLVEFIIHRFSYGTIEVFIGAIRSLKGLDGIKERKARLHTHDNYRHFLYEKSAARITFSIKYVLGSPKYLCHYLLPILTANDNYSDPSGFLSIDLSDIIRQNLKFCHHNWEITPYRHTNPYKTIFLLIEQFERVHKIRIEGNRLGRPNIEIIWASYRSVFFATIRKIKVPEVYSID